MSVRSRIVNFSISFLLTSVHMSKDEGIKKSRQSKLLKESLNAKILQISWILRVEECNVHPPILLLTSPNFFIDQFTLFYFI